MKTTGAYLVIIESYLPFHTVSSSTMHAHTVPPRGLPHEPAVAVIEIRLWSAAEPIVMVIKQIGTSPITTHVELCTVTNQGMGARAARGGSRPPPPSVGDCTFLTSKFNLIAPHPRSITKGLHTTKIYEVVLMIGTYSPHRTGLTQPAEAPSHHQTLV
ncbi:hypothetical protein L227DRAFT_34185 [Lentinus tigrinus ALCF2SS1-6]|uniref:Uncharacterized protein n=1 Tax=Lentinus tigrinus ALCF2SS1-6 TaxID=1328759 RepID=A0A5C2SGN4_9APHY|nr:hypothetical protein L227DRAFT_34185 [Lentinus tigrinus ALCF2SS1-6]